MSSTSENCERPNRLASETSSGSCIIAYSAGGVLGGRVDAAPRTSTRITEHEIVITPGPTGTHIAC